MLKRDARFQLRQLLILNIFVASSLALFVSARGWVATAPDQSTAILIGYFALVAWPLLMLLLSWAILKPGPNRDRVMTLFYLLVMLIGTPLIVALCLGNALASSTPVAGRWLAWGMILCFAFVVLFRVLPRIFREMIPLRCPRCRCRGLTGSHLEVVQTRPRRGLPLRYGFHWCSACGSRLVITWRKGPWEDASSPELDGYYSLGTPASVARWFWKQLRRQSAKTKNPPRRASSVESEEHRDGLGNG